jgi:hypothetical protein
VRTVPDKCPFCESPIMVHVGNLLRSEDGGFATYKCKTVQDVRWDEKYIRDGQSDVCRILEVQLLTKQRDEARERIKRLEEALAWYESTVSDCNRHGPQGDAARHALAQDRGIKAKEAKP